MALIDTNAVALAALPTEAVGSQLTHTEWNTLASATKEANALTRTANTFYGGPASGSPAAGAFRALVAADIAAAAAGYAPISHSHAANDLPNLQSLNGLLTVARGGTGLDTLTGHSLHVLRVNVGETAFELVAASSGFSDPMTTRGDTIFRNASNATARLGVGAAGRFLGSDGTDLAYRQVAAADVSGLGTMAIQGAGAVAITGGTITGIVDLAIDDGGTGASSASAARTNLGVAIGSNVQAWDADLDALAGISTTGFVRRTGAAAFSASVIVTGDLPSEVIIASELATALGDYTLTSALGDLALLDTITASLVTDFNTAADARITAASLQPLDADLTALAALSTTGMVRRTGAATFTASALVNADVDAAAAIAYSKLALTGAVVNGDIVSLAASKLTGTTAVANGGTGLASGTSGGIPYFSGSTAIASSGALTASALLLGGGAGASPTALGSLGTTTTVLHGNAAGAPTFGAVSLTADITGTLAFGNGGTGLAALGTALQSLRVNAGATALEYYTPSAGGSPPFDDATAIIMGSADPSKLLRIEVDGFTTATTRVATFPNANITVARSDAAQTFTGVQTFDTTITVKNPGSGATSLNVRAPNDGMDLFKVTATNSDGTWTADAPIRINVGRVTMGQNVYGAGHTFEARCSFFSESDTGSANLINYEFRPTWGTSSGHTCIGMRVNATDTSSAAASLLLDLGVGGASYVQKFKVDKAGIATSTANDAATATVLDQLILSHNSTGTPAAGLGAGLLLRGESSTTVDCDMARFAAAWTVVTHATLTSEALIQAVTGGGALATVAKFDGGGGAGTTGFFLFDVDNGQIERVTVGAADSGGSGFKVLRISN